MSDGGGTESSLVSPAPSDDGEQLVAQSAPAVEQAYASSDEGNSTSLQQQQSQFQPEQMFLEVAPTVVPNPLSGAPNPSPANLTPFAIPLTMTSFAQGSQQQIFQQQSQDTLVKSQNLSFLQQQQLETDASNDSLSTPNTVTSYEPATGDSTKRRRLEAPIIANAGNSANPSTNSNHMMPSAAATPTMIAPAMNHEPFELAAAGQQVVEQQPSKGSRKRSTPEQIERRRERNRLLAKKTREKKKNLMGTLQKQILELQRANQQLKSLVMTNLDETNSQKILNECDAMEKVPDTVWKACGTDKKELAADDFDFVRSIQTSQRAFVVTDPSLHDNPIVFCSGDFLKLTGYTREQVLGRNGRFLQGPASSPAKAETIRQALAAGEDVSVTMVNYRADGTPFWNRMFIAAVRDVTDQIVNYMGVMVQVARPGPGDPEHDTELPAPRMPERV